MEEQKIMSKRKKEDYANTQASLKNVMANVVNVIQEKIHLAQAYMLTEVESERPINIRR